MPRVRRLDRFACEAILHRNHVGRIAYVLGDRVDIEPIHYVYDGVAWIYGRTSSGAKLQSLRAGSSLGFEVDEIDDLFEWRSVVVHGRIELLSRETEPETWEEAVGLLRTLVPETFTDADPLPYRTVVFRIGVEEISGRTATGKAEAQDG